MPTIEAQLLVRCERERDDYLGQLRQAQAEHKQQREWAARLTTDLITADRRIATLEAENARLRAVIADVLTTADDWVGRCCDTHAQAEGRCCENFGCSNLLVLVEPLRQPAPAAGEE